MPGQSVRSAGRLPKHVSLRLRSPIVWMTAAGSQNVINGPGLVIDREVRAFERGQDSNRLARFLLAVLGDQLSQGIAVLDGYFGAAFGFSEEDLEFLLEIRTFELNADFLSRRGSAVGPAVLLAGALSGRHELGMISRFGPPRGPALVRNQTTHSLLDLAGCQFRLTGKN